MNKEHTVILIPGLGDDASKITFATKFWKKYGLTPVVHSVGWHDGEKDFKPKLKRIGDLIDGFSNDGNTVSLVGTSAGGSAVLNAFMERKEVVHKVVNVCGRLKAGVQKGFRSFEARTASSQSFAQSIRLCESREPFLTDTDRSKIMTVRAMFGDELVPADITVIPGAHNIRVPTFEHMFSISVAVTVLSKPIIQFLVG